MAGKYREKLYGTGACQGSECTMTLSALSGTPPPSSGQIKGKPQGYKPQPNQAKPAANPYIAAPTAELAIETTYWTCKAQAPPAPPMPAGPRERACPGIVRPYNRHQLYCSNCALFSHDMTAVSPVKRPTMSDVQSMEIPYLWPRLRLENAGALTFPSASECAWYRTSSEPPNTAYQKRPCSPARKTETKNEKKKQKIQIKTCLKLLWGKIEKEQGWTRIEHGCKFTCMGSALFWCT